MYFENRYQAGQMLAAKLQDFASVPTVILCLNDGAVLVAEPIAQSLSAPLFLLLMREITLPGPLAPTVGTVDQGGGFTYNTDLSKGEINEYVSEYHSHLEAEKIEKMHEIHRMVSAQGELDRSYLNDKSIILVSDGLATGAVVDAANDYLKPVKTDKIVAALPFASVPAVDRLHVATDELHILDVKANFFSTDHYYEDNALPGKDELQQRLQLFHKYM